MDGLISFFGPAPEAMDKTRYYAQRLELVLSQIDVAEQGLKDLGFPEHLYQKQFSRVRRGFSPSIFGNTWNTVLSYTTADVLVAFTWAAYALPADELEVPKEPLDDLLAEAEALQNHEALARLPEPVRKALREYFAAVVTAASQYNQTGIAPVIKAVRDLAGELDLEQEVIRAVGEATPEGASFVKQTKEFLSKALNTVKRAIDAGSPLVEYVDKTAKLIEKVYKGWEWLSNLLSGPPPPGT